VKFFIIFLFHCKNRYRIY